MTLYWIFNYCALNSNTVFNDWDAVGFRKALFTQLFLVFFVFFITQGLYAFIFKNTTQQDKKTKKQIMTADLQDKKRQLPWHQKKWNRQFSIIYTNHCVAIAICVLFSPFAGAVTIAYIHLAVFFVYFILQLMRNVMLVKLMKITMDVLNLILILIGLISINLATCTDSPVPGEGMCHNGTYLPLDMC